VQLSGSDHDPSPNTTSIGQLEIDRNGTDIHDALYDIGFETSPLGP
jgi:hypothetical protein